MFRYHNIFKNTIILKMLLIWNRLKAKEKTIYTIILFLFSTSINQYYGYQGLNPIDSFFSFNSGYDISKGYLPFRDYWTITGPFIALTQSLLFKIFGVSWSTYVMQASLFNFIIVITTFYTLYKFKLNVHYCFIYSLLVSIISYPSVGTPYVDHHATYLSVISIYFFILAVKTNLKIYWFLLPIILFLSFLTKQAPTGHFFIIISILSIIYFFFNFNLKKIIYGLSGSISITSLFILLLFINKISIIDFFEQYILFPLSLGESRLEFLLPLEFNRIFLRFKLIHLSYFLMILVIAKQISNRSYFIKINDFIIIFSLILSSYALIAHQLMTINGMFIFFIIPILIAFSHIYYSENFSNKKYIIYFLLFLSIVSTAHYGIKYINKRDFMDLRKINMEKSIDARSLDHKLSGLKWITTLYPDDPEKEINNLKEAINIIKNDSKNKAIVTDYQFISVVLSIYDFSPSQVWFNYHVNPEKGSKYYNIYKEFFYNKLKENDVQVVYVVKPLWGGNDVFEKVLPKACKKKKDLTEILESYTLLKCRELIK